MTVLRNTKLESIPGEVYSFSKDDSLSITYTEMRIVYVEVEGKEMPIKDKIEYIILINGKIPVDPREILELNENGFFEPQ